MRKSIGRYQIRSELGQGAMAHVYEAFDPEIDRTLAIKVLRREHSSNEEYRLRFLREAKAAGNLRHPNIVTVYDVRDEQRQPYIAMELLEGKTLLEAAKSEQPFSVREIVRIGMQLADALDYAHTHGVVHRDIKPSNIICLEGGYGIKITDFGIAHLDDIGDDERTRIGSVLGTPEYMSPEQIEGKPVDGRSDLFAVGVTLYQLVTHTKPFAGDTYTSLVSSILRDVPPPIDASAPATPKSLIKIIDKLLEKDPIRRFQTSADLKRSLINVLRQMDLVEEVERNKGFPMGIQWGAIMVLIVSLTMTAGIIVIDNRQFAAMSELAMDYGASMAQFIARQNIEPVALEDWPSVQVFAEYTARHPSFSYLYIVDSRGLTRGSMKPDESGGEHIADSSRVALADLAGTQVFQRETAEGELIYEFETPISVQGINIGKVIIGISQSPLHAVTLVTTWMLAALMLLTVAAVVVVVYLLARHLARPIKTLEQAFQNLAGGDLGFRISESRRDEFGRLFASFNHMAESLEENSSEPPDRSSDVVAVGETRVVVPPTP